MGETDLSTSNVGTRLIRTLFSTLDKPAYWLLSIVYELFFAVASADLFSNQTIFKFYGRVQAILGVFMMFQLSMTILKGIVNPDTFTGDKGGRALITKVITALILLTVLMPISIPNPKNEYEKQINNNGLLFGTLYSLQHRILSNNTIGRLVLGTTDSSSSITSTSTDDNVATSARIFTSTIVKGFYRINLKPENERDDTYLREGKDPAAYNDNRVCTDIDDDILKSYTRIDAEPLEIIGMVNQTCITDFNLLNYTFIGDYAGSKKFVFAYMPLVSTIVAIVFVFILLSFTIDVAVRAVKLAVLRLIAPIPIISYMDPKGGNDSAFNSWVKALTSTYLDLFIRLAVVYFVIFLIQDMIAHGVVMRVEGGWLLQILVRIIIWIGLFIFAKQAPKFIRQALGLKEDGAKLFSGFGELMGATALATGTIGAFNASRKASRESDIANGKNPNTIINRGKHLLAGVTGGVSGANAGMNAWQGAKDHQGSAVQSAIGKKTQEAMDRGLAGSTPIGRFRANTARAFQGEGATKFDAEKRGIQQKKDIGKSSKDLFSYLEGKGKTDGAGITVKTAKVKDSATGAEFNVVDSVDEYNTKRKAALDRARRGEGPATFEVVDDVGVVHTINANHAIAGKIEEELAYAAGDKWAEEYGASDNGFVQKQASYNESVKGASDPNGTGLYVEYQAGGDHTASRLKKTSKAAEGEALRGELDPGYKRRSADYGASKKS